MSEPAVTVPRTASVQGVARRMKRSGAGTVFIVDDENRLLGRVTDRDLAVRVLAPGLSAEVRVEAVMTRKPVAVDADADIMGAYRAMRAEGVQRIPVVSQGRLVGVITFEDLFRISMQGPTAPRRTMVIARGPLAP
ncbi:CBS domain-containing protein [Streptomyces rimosus]|uniref:CBS domain-containing protein n=1 Tax=Streptomyces rimosus TaxID=1927 RepID=UPI001F2D33BE|nr:CBS domain-containing protein [Streptomyces rimosus]